MCIDLGNDLAGCDQRADKKDFLNDYLGVDAGFRHPSRQNAHKITHNLYLGYVASKQSGQ